MRNLRTNQKQLARAERLAGKAAAVGPEGAELYRAVKEAIRRIRLAQVTQQQLGDGSRFCARRW